MSIPNSKYFSLVQDLKQLVHRYEMLRRWYISRCDKFDGLVTAEDIARSVDEALDTELEGEK